MLPRVSIVFALLTVVIGAPNLRAGEPLDLVPADSMLTWHGRAFPDAPAPDAGPTSLDRIIASVPQMVGERMTRGQRISLRILQACGQMIRYRHCIALIDASAIPAGRHPDSRQADELRLVMIVDTNGKSGPFLSIIQTAASEQTNTEHAKLVKKHAERWDYTELHDARLPDWYIVAWGEIDNHFVLTLGRDVWPRIAGIAAGKEPGLSRDPWVSEHRGERGRHALIEIIVDAARMRSRLDPLIHNWVSEFFEVWGAGKMQRAHWALGLNERAMYCVASFLMSDEGDATHTVERVFADSAEKDPRILNLVPSGSRYAIYRVPTSEILVNFVRSLFVWQSDTARERAGKLWAEIQEEFGFDAQRDVLDHLGEVAILHNYPTHPLRLPVFFTTLIEIKGDVKQVRKTVDVMCAAWQEGLDREAERSAALNPIRLNRDTDGMWYFPLGPFFNGLAWKVTDRYLVISWSPMALRQYLREAGDRLK